MGVPGFFAWILQKYSQRGIVCENIKEKINNLYIDANCLFHPQCFKVLDKYYRDPIDVLENKMINQIIQYITYLIDHVNPTLVYIAVDGVAPASKIKQQRIRRYKSQKDNELKNKIKEKYHIPIKDKWSNMSLTPGTQFMEKLHQELLKYFREFATSKKIKIIYSSYHVPGEGEHKILNYIKNDNSDGSTGKQVIYGLDADLIFLSMVCHNKSIYLLRETGAMSLDNHDNDINEVLTYANIDVLKQCFIEKITEMIYKKANDYGTDVKLNDNLINDIIFICYFLGNDFIPHLPTIDIKKNGLDILLESYVETYVKYQKPLIIYQSKNNLVNVDMIFLDNFISQLSTQEKVFFEHILPTHTLKCQNRICMSYNPYDIEIWNLDNMRIIKSLDVYKLDQGTIEDWKFRYYEYYFGGNEHQDDLIKKLCEQYLDGIMWSTKYYFEGCPSWDWVFPYVNAPFLSDLSKFIRASRYDINQKKFNLGEPLKPLTQLLSVIHPAYSHLLPPEYQKLMINKTSPIIDLFPIDIVFDTANKDLLWQCNPKLPYTDLERIKKETKQLTRYSKENILNTQTDDICLP